MLNNMKDLHVSSSSPVGFKVKWPISRSDYLNKEVLVYKICDFLSLENFFTVKKKKNQTHKIINTKTALV